MRNWTVNKDNFSRKSDCKEYEEQRGTCTRRSWESKKYFVCLIVFKMKDLCVFICLKEETSG